MTAVGTGPHRERRDVRRRTRRTRRQATLDFATFPVRAVLPWRDDRWGLTSRRSERFIEVASRVQGHTLDIGCGRHDIFVREFLGGRGLGIDVFAYDGLEPNQIVEDMRRLPYAEGSFDTVTMVATLNHIPERDRDAELAEAHRCLRSGGNIVVTMGHPVAEWAIHKLVAFYDRVLGTSLDVDDERGMHEDEAYFVPNSEIAARLRRAGFTDVTRRRFSTQWGLNGLVEGWKP
jgi:SAM-dependent methyltransferase